MNDEHAWSKVKQISGTTTVNGRTWTVAVEYVEVFANNWKVAVRLTAADRDAQEGSFILHSEDACVEHPNTFGRHCREWLAALAEDGKIGEPGDDGKPVHFWMRNMPPEAPGS